MGALLIGISSEGSSIMRFIQILKVYNRLKYIGVFFGDNLQQVLNTIGNIFTDSEEGVDKIDRIRIQEASFKGKVSYYRVFMNMTSTMGWKIWAYLISFFVTLICSKVAKNMKN